MTASEAICEAPLCTVREKGGLPQIQPKSSLQAKNVPWPQNGASAVVEGRRPGRDWCRWRTVPGTSTLAPAHTGSALCPLVCPETWSAPDSSPAVPRPFLPLAAWQRGPTRPSGSLYHYSAHRPFTPSTPGQPLPSEFWGRNFPVLHTVFKDEFSCQEWISLYFWQKFTNGGFQQSLSFTSSSFYMGMVD